MPPAANVWVKGHGWFGPSYPDAGEPPAPAARQGGGFAPAKAKGEKPEPEPAKADQPAEQLAKSTGTAPAQAGPGSSRAKWVTYATDNGIEVSDDMSRDEIIAACRAAGLVGE